MNKLEQCAICQKPTDKCCSLCRKVFYCSAEHQQVDWYRNHKFLCDGKIEEDDNLPENNQQDFLIYNQNKEQRDQIKKQEQYRNFQNFLESLEERLILRNKILKQISKVNERSPSILLESLVKQTQELMKLSTKITREDYKPSFSRKINNNEIKQLGYHKDQDDNEMSINETNVEIQYISDNLLMAKVYHLAALKKQAKALLISMGRYLENSEKQKIFLDMSFAKKQTGQNFASTKPITSVQQELLKAIIQVSDFYNIDKTTETMYKLFIKKIEQSQGIWEQIYAYFNIAVWYSQKTYYDKSVKAFTYALEMINSHKKNIQESGVLKADCNYNIALGYWAQGERVKALEHMQEAYRGRANFIGKNTMQTSNCLMKLAVWFKQVQKWNECLQYLDECHRIRKIYQNQPEHARALENTKIFISEIYQNLSTKKKNSLDTHTDPQYFKTFLEKQEIQRKINEERNLKETEFLPKDSFTSRLFRDDRQYVNFKVVITPEMYDTYSSHQLQFIDQLIDLTDEKMEKSQAIRILGQSKFVSVLQEEQREAFMEANRID